MKYVVIVPKMKEKKKNGDKKQYQLSHGQFFFENSSILNELAKGKMSDTYIQIKFNFHLSQMYQQVRLFHLLLCITELDVCVK